MSLSARKRHIRGVLSPMGERTLLFCLWGIALQMTAKAMRRQAQGRSEHETDGCFFLMLPEKTARWGGRMQKNVKLWQKTLKKQLTNAGA